MTMIKEATILKRDSLGRVRVPHAKREEMLDAFERSGMSARAFAHSHGVKKMTFASWVQKRRRARGDYEKEETRRKLRMPKASKTSQLQEGMSLLEVEVSAPSSSSLEVMLPNGAKVLLSEERQIPLLKTLLRELSC